jgi:hypothetical protein
MHDVSFWVQLGISCLGCKTLLSLSWVHHAAMHILPAVVQNMRSVGILHAHACVNAYMCFGQMQTCSVTSTVE